VLVLEDDAVHEAQAARRLAERFQPSSAHWCVVAGRASQPSALAIALDMKTADGWFAPWIRSSP
jgi:hypothetical protein